jgi:hypothetical protein
LATTSAIAELHTNSARLAPHTKPRILFSRRLKLQDHSHRLFTSTCTNGLFGGTECGNDWS